MNTLWQVFRDGILRLASGSTLPKTAGQGDVLWPEPTCRKCGRTIVASGHRVLVLGSAPSRTEVAARLKGLVDAQDWEAAHRIHHANSVSDVEVWYLFDCPHGLMASQMLSPFAPFDRDRVLFVQSIPEDAAKRLRQWPGWRTISATSAK